MIFVFTLTHGQSQVERGFNINSDIVIENLKPEALCAQRMVYDQLKSDQVGSHNIVIPNELRLSCMTASSKYKAELEKAKLTAVDNKKAGDISVINESIEQVKRQRAGVLITIETLEKESGACFDLAGATEVATEMQSHLIKGNALRKAVGAKRKLVEDSDLVLVHLIDEKKSKPKYIEFIFINFKFFNCF